MNNIKKTIGWADYSWNPVFGCDGGCSYCYARRAAVRFARPWGLDPADPFKPTFHPERLAEPLRLKKPSRIFVGSMTDLFGQWVPNRKEESWVETILLTVRRCPQHTFIFLTKNPRRYAEFDFPPNCWLGVTVTGDDEPNRKRINLLLGLLNRDYRNPLFASYEPMLGPYPDFKYGGLSWFIMGAMTGPGASKYAPKLEWIEDAVAQCRERGIPIFEKSSLAPIVGRPLIQEYPR